MNAQYSLLDQLKELVKLANKAGLYDAADYLSVVINRIERKSQYVQRIFS